MSQHWPSYSFLKNITSESMTLWVRPTCDPGATQPWPNITNSPLDFRKLEFLDRKKPIRGFGDSNRWNLLTNFLSDHRQMELLVTECGKMAIFRRPNFNSPLDFYKLEISRPEKCLVGGFGVRIDRICWRFAVFLNFAIYFYLLRMTGSFVGFLILGSCIHEQFRKLGGKASSLLTSLAMKQKMAFTLWPIVVLLRALA